MRHLFLIASLLSFAACSAPPPEEREQTPGANPGSQDATGESPGLWLSMTKEDAPSERSAHTAVWTGTQMLIWGGRDESETFLATGGIYDHQSKSWSPLARAGAPSGRVGHTAVWAGGHMVVWGGLEIDKETGGMRATGTGGRFDPITSEWRPTSLSGAPSPRSGHTAVAAAGRMVVFGGGDSEPLADGAIYDPLSDKWTPISTESAPSARRDHVAVWTGSKMIVWGGAGLDGLRADGAVYDLATNSWQPLPTEGAPIARKGATAVWIADRLIVYGGIARDVEGNAVRLGDGGILDLAAGIWMPLPTPGMPKARTGHAAVAVGERMVILGGHSSQALDDGAIFDLATGTWTPIRGGGSRAGHTAVFAGDVVLVWGGYSARGSYLSSGMMYILP